MTNSNTNQPLATIRAGALKVTIWGNPGKNGRTRYSVDLSRLYTDKEGNWRNSHHFSQNELLRAAKLAEKAYEAIGDLRSEVRSGDAQ